MKSKSFKNLIFGFLSKVKIKKFLLVIYCVVPILIISVGFAAWRITGNETFGASGSFISYPIINSYEYVPDVDFKTNGNGLYPTRFYDKDNNPVDVAKIDVTATIDLSNCRTLLNDRNSGDVIYAEFSLGFSDGTAMKAFFNNLSLEVTASINKENYAAIMRETEESKSFNGANITSNTPTYSSSSYTVQLNIDLQSLTNNATTTEGNNGEEGSTATEGNNGEEGSTATEGNNGEEGSTATGDNKYVYLKLTYTLDPNASDYQTLYNTLVNNDLKFMVDVKITDINPTQKTSGN